MPDRYLRLAASKPGQAVMRRLSLPVPVPLQRYHSGRPEVAGPVALVSALSGRLHDSTQRDLASIGSTRWHPVADPKSTQGVVASNQPAAAILLDATGIRSSAELVEIPTLLAPLLPGLAASGRVIVLGTPPTSASSVAEAVAQRALEGVTRSLAKELRAGATCNLVYVEPGAEQAVESTLRFFLSARSAYVSGQVVRVAAGAPTAAPDDWSRPLAGTVALVTGAARGIGEQIAAVLARDGAQVVCLDVPAQAEAVRAVAQRIGGAPLALDLTDKTAPETIAQHLEATHGGLDIVVHNAGITRDKTLARTNVDRWSSVIDVNLTAVERLTAALLEGKLIRPGGSIACMSSITALAGNRGQTNYAASKAGLIGLVEALAPALAAERIRVNAVAPGFIETQMTAHLPFAVREAGRRLNSLGQGGEPIDVAETVAWLVAPATAGVTGQVVRVCGQAMLGA